MKNVTIRIDAENESMLNEISTKPTTATQEIIEVFTWLRKQTIHELKGMFTREEIIGLADSFNGLMPTWRIMCNPSALLFHTEDAEKYQSSISMHGGNIETLVKKIEKLSSAQATILQLELWAFWNRDENNGSPDLEVLIKKLS
jgi:nitrate/nitrite-specific signal transduction histidine kinase